MPAEQAKYADLHLTEVLQKVAIGNKGYFTV